jgi:thymidylate synthase
MPLTCNEEYRWLLRMIDEHGDELETRNHRVKSIIDYPQIIFTETPLITTRKVAWKKSIKEMSWFLSGDPECPEELLDWWDGQLNENGRYLCGYGEQLRHSGSLYSKQSFDQIKFLLKGLRDHPESRRLVATTWNPRDMAYITQINLNENTPSCCHATIIQCFVRDNKLHMTQYQRSADVLLGVPHNWCQYFSLLLYLAYWSELEVGSLRWIFGDVHLYQEESHIECARQIIESPLGIFNDPPRLMYMPTVEWTGTIPEFKASDFTMEGVIPEPLVTIRPKLF